MKYLSCVLACVVWLSVMPVWAQTQAGETEFTGAVFLTLCITFIIAFGTGGSAWAAKILNKF